MKKNLVEEKHIVVFKNAKIRRVLHKNAWWTAQLKKEDVNLKAKWLTITDPKNHEPHTLPLTIYLHDLLKRRIDASCNEYVFPSSGEAGYLVEPRKQMAKIIEKTEIQFTVHDLRRTFITIAESLDIPAYALKRLLNHKMYNSDVTAGYIITDVERLRRPMQQIEAYILKKCLDKS
jgi:integrase